MNRIVGPGLALLVCLVTAPGCTLSPISRTSEVARDIEPLDESQTTGTLIARVEGHPRGIQYYVNGVAIEPEEEIQWWKDARLQLELKTGSYEVSATYVARGFAPDVKKYRIETKKPVHVAAGRVTEILAVINKDWRGFPESDTVYFQPVEPGGEGEGRESRAEVETRQTAAEDQPQAEEQPRAEGQPQNSEVAQAEPDMLVVRGRPDGEDEVIQIQGSTAAPPDAPSGAITIRGSDVVSPGAAATSSEPSATATPGAAAGGESATLDETTAGAEVRPQAGETAGASPASTDNAASDDPATAPAGAAESAVGLPDNAEPANEDIPEPGAGETPVVVGGDAGGRARTPWVTVLLESQPSGAKVSVDDELVGQTPVRVRLDASADHVVQFSREGCGEHVRFLSAAAWERGMNPKLRAELECP